MVGTQAAGGLQALHMSRVALPHHVTPEGCASARDTQNRSPGLVCSPSAQRPVLSTARPVCGAGSGAESEGCSHCLSFPRCRFPRGARKPPLPLPPLPLESRVQAQRYCEQDERSSSLQRVTC